MVSFVVPLLPPLAHSLKGNPNHYSVFFIFLSLSQLVSAYAHTSQ